LHYLTPLLDCSGVTASRSRDLPGILDSDDIATAGCSKMDQRPKWRDIRD